MTWRILEGDCRTVLAGLDLQSVHTCVTSPPYFGLRDYGTAEWEGGDPRCDHIMKASARNDLGADDLARRAAVYGTGSGSGSAVSAVQFRESCGKCGAGRVDQQIGLEPSPDEFVAALVDVFREVRRVLRDDGTVWLNLGDSYNNRSVARPSSHQGGLGFTNDSIERTWADQTKLGLSRLSIADGDLKEKDLLGIPWMVAFALRADGWYLRSDIIWNKPNPMPESVTDRPTKSHEYVFLLSKSAKYHYDADAIRETRMTGLCTRQGTRRPTSGRASVARTSPKA
jgi:DNA modification methylase